MKRYTAIKEFVQLMLQMSSLADQKTVRGNIFQYLNNNPIIQGMTFFLTGDSITKLSDIISSEYNPWLHERPHSHCFLSKNMTTISVNFIGNDFYLSIN